MDKKTGKKKKQKSGKLIKTGKEAQQVLEEKLKVAVVQWQTTFDAIFFDAIKDAVSLIDAEGKILRCNKAMSDFLGKPFQEIIGRRCLEMVHGTSEPIPGCPVVRIKETLQRETLELPVGDKWFEVTADPILDESGSYSGAVHIISDITERKQAEMAFKKSTELYQRFMDSSSDDVLLKDENFKLLIVNKSYKERMSKYGKEILGKTAFDLLPLETAEGCTKSDVEALKSDSVLISEEQLGDRIFETRKFRVNLGDDKFGVGGFIRDITERKRLEEELRALSLIDELTSLYNRRGFFNLAQQQLKLAKRTKRGPLFFIADLDGLNQINDTYGHEKGDMALIEAAGIMKETFRESDIIGRIGGDEFAGIMVEDSNASAGILAARFQESLDAHNAKSTRPYNLSISIGIAHCDPESSPSIDELLKKADKLMYEQKRNKRKNLF